MRHGSWKLLRAIGCVELIEKVLCAYGTNISIMDDLRKNDISK